MPLEFRIEKKLAHIHDPRAGFELREVEAEIRYDPLTGQSGRICHFALGKIPLPDLSPLAEQTRANCPFCPERVEAVTPRYPESLLPGGRLRHGGALLVPNLFPYDDVSAVAVLCPEHAFSMRSISEQAVRDGLALTQKFFAATSPAVAGGTGFGMLSWNFMPPSGGTQIHPHMQVVLTTNPGNTVTRLLAAEAEYHGRTGRAYLADLLAEEEKRGERWVGRTGGVAWHVPFVPGGVLGDAQAVFPGCATLADLGEADMADFARGLARILRGFTERGLWSFNLAFMPARFGPRDAAGHVLCARVLPRLYVSPALHASDASSLKTLLEESAAMVYPEETAALLRAALAGN
jgi:galactose-1-phosphate uridylyltransferase